MPVYYFCRAPPSKKGILEQNKRIVPLFFEAEQHCFKLNLIIKQHYAQLVSGRRAEEHNMGCSSFHDQTFYVLSMSYLLLLI